MAADASATPTGRRVVLRAGSAVLEVDPGDGARWTSLQVDGLELLTASRDPALPRSFASGCFPMAPFAGRMREGRLEHGGRTWQLPADMGQHAMHGTVVDARWTVVRHTMEAVSLVAPLAAPWPFAGTVRMGLALHPDRLHAVLSLDAEQDMPVVLGLHPWLRRRLDRGGEAELEVRGGRQYVTAPDDVPTGELMEPAPGPWDDCFRGLDQPLRVIWPGALALSVTSDSDHWVLYDERPEAVCVEPQTGPPDAARLGLARIVHAGEQHALDCTLAWSAADRGV